MITFMSALLKKVNWSALVAVLVGAAGVLVGIFRNQKATAVVAEAERKVAEKTAEVAVGNAAAARAETKAVANAATAAKEVAAVPDDALDKLGAEMGMLRGDK